MIYYGLFHDFLKQCTGAILHGSPSLKERQKSAILHMKTTLKLKINMSREYLGLFIYPQQPSAGLPNLVRLSL
jgi:hypothetical protein